MRNLFAAILFLLAATPALALPETIDGKAALFPLTYVEAEEAVGRALSEKGAGDKVAASINGRGNQPLYSYTGPLTVEIRGLKFDKPSAHWSANLLLVADGQVVTAMPAAGRYDTLAEVPVLKRQVKNGDVIRDTDIEIRDLPVSQTRADIVTDIASLIGRSPLHSISAFRPIREHEIAMPPLVKKNNIVQMRYQSPGMEITTTGQALEDGAKGSVIGVRNLTSKRVVQAVVDDVSAVSVRAAGDQLLSQAGASHAAN